MIEIPKKYTYGPNKPGFVDYYLASEMDKLLQEVIDTYSNSASVTKVADKIKRTMEQS